MFPFDISSMKSKCYNYNVACVFSFSQGKVVLPMPSIEVLAEAAWNSDRRIAVIHVLESSVVSWMKQVKVGTLQQSLYGCDVSISQTDGIAS